MPTQKSLEIAAQCWCEPETSGIEMNSKLAIVFAKRLDEAVKVQDAKPFATFPKHQASLCLNHNQHKNDYETVQEHIESLPGFYQFESEEAKNRCVEMNELWSLQYYPKTPTGFICVAAPTLQELLDFVHSTN